MQDNGKTLMTRISFIFHADSRILSIFENTFPFRCFVFRNAFKRLRRLTRWIYIFESLPPHRHRLPVTSVFQALKKRIARPSIFGDARVRSNADSLFKVARFLQILLSPTVILLAPRVL